MVQSCCHLLDGIEFVSNTPDHEIDIRTQADRRVGVNQKPGAKVGHRGHELFATMELVSFVKKPPFRPCAIESEIDKLSGQLRLELFEFCATRRKTQGTACSTALFFVGTHFVASD